MENLLSSILEALAEPAVSYIGLGYDKTIGIRAGMHHGLGIWDYSHSLPHLCMIVKALPVLFD